jgi:hypothetical protein
MKKYLLFLLPVIALCTLFAFRAEKSVLLRVHLQKGSTYLYKTSLNQNVVTQIAGQSMNAKVNMESGMDLKVTEKYKDSMLMNAIYRHMAVNLSSMGRHQIVLDSRDSSGGTGSRFKKFFSTLQAHPVVIKTDAEGNILDMRGLEQLQQAVNASGATSNPAARKLLDNLLSDETFKHHFTNLGIFPDKPVAVGDHWERTTHVNNMVTVDVHTTLTVNDIQPDKVLLGIKADMSSQRDSATIQGMTMPVHLTGTQTGTYTIDRATGLISSGAIDQKINMKMSMMGQDMATDITGTYNVSESLEK